MRKLQIANCKMQIENWEEEEVFHAETRRRGERTGHCELGISDFKLEERGRLQIANCKMQIENWEEEEWLTQRREGRNGLKGWRGLFFAGFAPLREMSFLGFGLA